MSGGFNYVAEVFDFGQRVSVAVLDSGEFVRAIEFGPKNTATASTPDHMAKTQEIAANPEKWLEDMVSLLAEPRPTLPKSRLPLDLLLSLSTTTQTHAPNAID